jgi:hypothetical protein
MMAYPCEKAGTSPVFQSRLCAGMELAAAQQEWQMVFPSASV